MMEMEDEGFGRITSPPNVLRNRNLHKTFTGSNFTISEAEMRSLPNLYTSSLSGNDGRYFRHPLATQYPYAQHPRYPLGSRKIDGRGRVIGGGGRRTLTKSPRVLQTLRQKSGKFVLIPKIKDINIIDKYSRVIFPVSFIVFNICYWSFYFIV